LVDWTVEPQWLDKEISQILGRSGHTNPSVALLFKVRFKDGEEQWILFHLEIQENSQASPDTPDETWKGQHGFEGKRVPSVVHFSSLT